MVNAKMKFYSRTLIQSVLAVLVLFVGISIAKKLISMKRPPQKKERAVIAPLVNAQRVRQKDNIRMIVSGYGTVEPKIKVRIVPQVSGRAVYVHSEFTNGGFFKSDEVLIRIDPSDYELAVEKAASEVAKAKTALDTQKAEAEVAGQEWKQLNPGQKPTNPLVLREPQIRQAEAELAAANASLATAKLNLERTEISLPFNGRVLEEDVDEGQYLQAASPVGTAYGTDAVEIVVPLEDAELGWFDVPLISKNADRNGKSARGSKAIVKSDFAGSEQERQGYIIRTEGQIDPDSRVVNVVVGVNEPFDTSDGKTPLIPGMFVEVNIKGIFCVCRGRLYIISRRYGG